MKTAEGLGREYLFTRADFQRIVRISMDEAGIELTETKEPLVYSRLVKRLRTLGLQNFSQYCDLVSRKDETEERRLLISALTTNTTRFFRENHHFEMLIESILPGLLDRARHGGRVRIWSAGCSSGEEPYSIAFTVLKACPEIARHDFKILATDIDPQILSLAARGIYSEQVIGGLPPDQKAQFFSPAAPGATDRSVAAAARELITFKELNLIRPWPVKGPFDVVFCRNVAIYFDANTQDVVWRGFASVIETGGHLFIGHSERLSPSVKTVFEIVGMTAFRKLPGSPKSAGPIPTLERG